MSLQKSTIDTMDKYLGGQYFIPNYQRDYSWEDDELSDFWEDLISLAENNPDGAHFFGQVVIHNDEVNNKKFIIDGQQRTISSMIFLKTMQQKYLQLYSDYGLDGAHRKESTIETNYLSKYVDDRGYYNLTLGNPDDSEFFINYILNGNPDECPKRNRRKSHDRLANAYLFFSNKIDDFISKGSTEASEIEPQRKLEQLNRLYTSFTEHFRVSSSFSITISSNLTPSLSANRIQ